jgi:hypothetical protein
VRLRRDQIACDLVENKPVWFSFGRTDFEHKLKVTNCRPLTSVNTSRRSFFTESLILAQDERWRRA